MPPGSVKMAISFQYDSVIRRYRIYKEIWEASHGETLMTTGDLCDVEALWHRSFSGHKKGRRDIIVIPHVSR